MKKLIMFVMLLFAVLTLSGCEYLFPHVTPNELQTKLMSSREVIRASNVGILVESTSNGLMNRHCNFTSKGSGVVYKEDAEYFYVLTNYHVIEDQGCPNVTYAIYLLNFTDEEDAIEAEIVAFDEDYDLAVLRFLKDDFDIRLIDIQARFNTTLRRGEMVLSVGNPSGVDAIVTYGEYLRMTNIDMVDFPVIYHSAMIYSGNSGGALTDIDGNLIGINTWGNPDNTEGLAIPLTKIHEFLDETELHP